MARNPTAGVAITTRKPSENEPDRWTSHPNQVGRDDPMSIPNARTYPTAVP